MLVWCFGKTGVVCEGGAWGMGLTVGREGAGWEGDLGGYGVVGASRGGAVV